MIEDESCVLCAGSDCGFDVGGRVVGGECGVEESYGAVWIFDDVDVVRRVNCDDNVARAGDCLRNDTVEQAGGSFGGREQDDGEVGRFLDVRGFASQL